MSLNSSIVESFYYWETLPQDNAFWQDPVLAGSLQWRRYAKRERRGICLPSVSLTAGNPWFVCVNILSDGNCDFVEGPKPIRPLCLRGTPPPTFHSGLLVLSKLNRIPLPFIV